MILPFLFLLAAAKPAPAPDPEELAAALRKFTQVLSIARSEAADPVDVQNAIYGGAIPGMLRKLDPHSVFFDPQQFEQLKQMERSEQKGFGTVVSVVPGRVVVLQALPGTPSAKAGLAPGDEIVVVNNIPLNRLDVQQLVQFLGMARQRQVSIQVRRPGNVRLLHFVLNPALVDTPTVDRAFLLHSGIGYIRVTSWDPQTGQQLKEAIEKLGGAKLPGLVLDLRNNPGGVVQSALQAAALFLQPGQKILSVKGRAIQGDEADVPKTATPYTFPLAVLIDERTASASEILTGALQDHDRATVIGVPSYGKGLVQNVISLANNTAMALTTAFYYTPSGRSIQKPLATGQLAFAPDPHKYHTDSGRSVTGGGGIVPDRIVQPEGQTRLRIALDASGSFTNFATDYTQKHKIDDTFDVTPAMLDEFQAFVAQRAIQPPVGEWLADRDWIASRLKQEVFNQGVSIAKGDEIEMARDPEVRAAVDALRRQTRASVH